MENSRGMRTEMNIFGRKIGTAFNDSLYLSQMRRVTALFILAKLEARSVGSYQDENNEKLFWRCNHECTNPTHGPPSPCFNLESVDSLSPQNRHGGGLKESQSSSSGEVNPGPARQNFEAGQSRRNNADA